MKTGYSLTQNLGPLSRLFFLFLFYVGGTAIAIILASLFSVFFVESSPYDVTTLSWIQIISAIFMFMLPAIGYAYLFHKKNFLDYLQIKSVSSLKLVIWTIILVLVAQPIIVWFAQLNEAMILPDSLKPLETWMRNKEDAADSIISLFLEDKSLFSYLRNIFIIGILAAICEELIFRACLQSIINKLVKNNHASIWITAFIFSAIHLQFYGFIPRLLAGAFLGYLLVWTKSLWIPILAHAFHNIFTILIAQFTFGTPYYEYLDSVDTVYISIVGTLSILVLAILIFYLKKNKVLLSVSINST